VSKKRTYEQWLKDQGKRVVQEGDTIDGVQVLKIIKPSVYTRVATMCPHCGEVSIIFMGNFANGQSRCSNGCFRGRPRRSALPDLPAPKKKEKTKEHTAKKATSDWWSFKKPISDSSFKQSSTARFIKELKELDEEPDESE